MIRLLHIHTIINRRWVSDLLQRRCIDLYVTLYKHIKQPIVARCNFHFSSILSLCTLLCLSCKVSVGCHTQYFVTACCRAPSPQFPLGTQLPYFFVGCFFFYGLIVFVLTIWPAAGQIAYRLCDRSNHKIAINRGCFSFAPSFTQWREILSRNTRDSMLSYGVNPKSLSHLGLNRYWVVTDGQTDEQNCHS